MTARTTSIYILFDPREPEEIRYVGKTIRKINERICEHRREAANNTHRHVYHWINKLQREGIDFDFRVVETCAEGWEEREQFWIDYYVNLGCKVTNHTEGGRGIVGYKHTAEAKAAMSEKRKGNKYCLGVKHTDETKAKLSAIHKGRKPSEANIIATKLANTGAKRTEESKQRMSEAQKNKNFDYVTDEYKTKMSVALKGKPKPPKNPNSGFKYVYIINENNYKIRCEIGDIKYYKSGFKTPEEANQYLQWYMEGLVI